jgi:ferrochelatase
MAYGSPDKDEDIEPYYAHIRGGKNPSFEELENLRARYKVIGGRSPLLAITASTANKLEKKLGEQGGATKVNVGMKHWHPFVSETFDIMQSEGVTDLLAIVLAPHYSIMSIGSYQDAVRKANLERGGGMKITVVDSWHLDPVFIEKWRRRIELARDKAFENRKQVFFLFSAHSLPERILTWNDPYKAQLLETMERLAAKLSLEPNQFGFAFQSAGHTLEPWLGPDILDKLRELRKDGWDKILVIPIGFVSDHLEILYDIDIEAAQLAKELGMHLARTESFNDSDDFIEVLLSVIQKQGSA